VSAMSGLALYRQNPKRYVSEEEIENDNKKN
jgi:hypothetical protein